MKMLRAFRIAAPLLLVPTFATAQTPPIAPPSGPPPVAAPPGTGPWGPLPPAGAPPGAAPWGPLPPAAPQPERPTKLRNPNLMIGGLVLLGLSVPQIVGGSLFLASTGGDFREFGGFALLGIPIIISGVLCVAAGIPMTVIGAQDVPADGRRAMPTVVPARNGAALQWVF